MIKMAAFLCPLGFLSAKETRKKGQRQANQEY